MTVKTKLGIGYPRSMVTNVNYISKVLHSSYHSAKNIYFKALFINKDNPIAVLEL